MAYQTVNSIVILIVIVSSALNESCSPRLKTFGMTKIEGKNTLNILSTSSNSSIHFSGIPYSLLNDNNSSYEVVTTGTPTSLIAGNKSNMANYALNTNTRGKDNKNTYQKPSIPGPRSNGGSKPKINELWTQCMDSSYIPNNDKPKLGQPIHREHNGSHNLNGHGSSIIYSPKSGTLTLGTNFCNKLWGFPTARVTLSCPTPIFSLEI